MNTLNTQVNASFLCFFSLETQTQEVSSIVPILVSSRHVCAHHITYYQSSNYRDTKISYFVCIVNN